MPRSFLPSPMRVRLVAALITPALCAAAAPEAVPAGPSSCAPERPQPRQAPPTRGEPVICGKARTRAPAPPPAAPPSSRPGPSHKAWFDDYSVKGAGLVER
jgi:hypothetical protein